jgi:hypothetical protein
MNLYNCKIKPNKDFKLSKIATTITTERFNKLKFESILVNDIEEISKLQKNYLLKIGNHY